jgi:hypothetical protein
MRRQANRVADRRATDIIKAMQQALTSSVARAVVVASLLLAGTLASWRSHAAHDGREVRLVLHAPSSPSSIYLSWWRNGDVRIAVEPGELPAMTFTVRGWVDGCHWKGTELLEPIDAKHFAYSYQETLLHCRPGAVPWIKTPRTGIVTVEE